MASKADSWQHFVALTPVLLWLTLDNLKQVSKFEKAKPLFDGFAHPNATAAMSVPVEVTTLRKNLENFRSVLYSAAQHLKTVDMPDSQRATLMKQYNEAYQDFGELSVDRRCP